MSQCVSRDLFRNFLEIAVQCMHVKQPQMCLVKKFRFGVQYNYTKVKNRIKYEIDCLFW